MSELDSANKIDVPSEHWDLFAPSACLVMITTADREGRINAASFGTCVRVCHDPVFIAFTVGAAKDTCNNVLATGEFVVNVPPFEREILEKVRVVGLEFPPRVNELEKAGLTPIPARVLRPPRIAECRAHFECKVEWTKAWLYRVMICGKVSPWAIILLRSISAWNSLVLPPSTATSATPGTVRSRRSTTQSCSVFNSVSETFGGPLS